MHCAVPIIKYFLSFFDIFLLYYINSCNVYRDGWMFQKPEPAPYAALSTYQASDSAGDIMAAGYSSAVIRPAKRISWRISVFDSPETMKKTFFAALRTGRVIVTRSAGSIPRGAVTAAVHLSL